MTCGPHVYPYVHVLIVGQHLASYPLLYILIYGHWLPASALTGSVQSKRRL